MKKTPLKRQSPYAKDSVPTYFADQPAAIQTGPYTTKITLGSTEDEESDFPKPVITFVMPTVNIMRMVEELHEMFNDPGFRTDSRKMLEADMANFFSAKQQVLPKPIALKRLRKPTSSS